MLTENLLMLFSKDLRQTIEMAEVCSSDDVEEIRLRIGYPISVVKSGMNLQLSTARVTDEHLDYFFERATRSSIHAYAEQIQSGYLFTVSGYRIGLCGTVYHTREGLIGIRDLTSASVRIPHAVPGCADKVFPKLTESGFQSTLILSPPGYGKTTLLRDLIRKLSVSGMRISLIDERGEIAAAGNRKPFFELGPNTDVMTGGRKSQCAMNMLRAMNPQILAFDEITEPKDLDAAAEATGCGVALLATAHAADYMSFLSRPLYQELLSLGVFHKAVWIRMNCGRRNYVVEDFDR